METQYCRVEFKPLVQVPVPQYTEEEHGTWELLIQKQFSLMPGRACDEFIEGLRRLDLPRKQIPKLIDVSKRIESFTGWKLLRVDGLVHPRDFFKLLSQRIFPSTDFIRKRNELMYTPAPDMFHDLFGHTPLLTNPDFTEFFEAIGNVGAAALAKYPEDHEVHLQLQRLYWFTVEFGLVKHSAGGMRAYGAGSVSSPQELEFCVGPDCRRHPFDVQITSNQDYDIWHLQEDVFVVESFADLGKKFRAWAAKHKILEKAA